MADVDTSQRVTPADFILNMPRHDKVIHFVLGPMCALSLLITSASVFRHLTAKGSDRAHALTVRILLMVPAYSFIGWLSLYCRFTTFAKVLVALEKFYECIVLFAFLQLLVLFLGGFRKCREAMTDDECHHMIPVRWVLPADSWTPPELFLQRSLGLVALYVPIMLMCFVVTFIFYFLPLPHAAFKALVAVCSGIVFLATFVAMYGLVLFYHANMTRLEPVQPLLKLASIKILVMISAWQEFGVKIANYFGAFNRWVAESKSHYTHEEFAEAVLAALLIMEMLLLSFAHVCIWPANSPMYDVPEPRPEDFLETPDSSEDTSSEDGSDSQPEGAERSTFCRRVCLVLHLHDVLDFWRTLRKHTSSESANGGRAQQDKESADRGDNASDSTASQTDDNAAVALAHSS